MFPGFDHQEALATSNGAASLDNPIRQGVARVLFNASEADVPELDLGTTRIDDYLDEHGETVFDGVDEQHRPVVAAQLKTLQRVFKVAPKSKHMHALMGEGLDSAFKISNQSQKAFVEQFAPQVGGEARATEIYRNAEQVTDTTTNLFANLHQAIYDVTPAVVNAGNTASLVEKIPNWSTLFGRLDFCGCSDCRSVYSPAAYFVDLLQFLNPTTGSGIKPLEVLREHRPDWSTSSSPARTPTPPYLTWIWSTRSSKATSPWVRWTRASPKIPATSRQRSLA
jgi:hypothetical protein